MAKVFQTIGRESKVVASCSAEGPRGACPSTHCLLFVSIRVSHRTKRVLVSKTQDITQCHCCVVSYGKCEVQFVVNIFCLPSTKLACIPCSALWHGSAHPRLQLMQCNVLNKHRCVSSSNNAKRCATPNHRDLRHSSGSFPTMQTTPVLQANPKDYAIQQGLTWSCQNRFRQPTMLIDACQPSKEMGVLPKLPWRSFWFCCRLLQYHFFRILLCKPFWCWLTSVQGNCLSPCGRFLTRQREPVNPSPAGCHGDWTEITPDIRNTCAKGRIFLNSQCQESSLKYPVPSKTPISPG